MPVLSQSAPERMVYVIDSIPFFEPPDNSLGELLESDIEQLVIISHPDSIKALGYQDVDKLAFIQTKAYLKRADSLRAVPNIWRMQMKGDIWYDQHVETPYSGPFAEYYLNGTPKGTGFLHEGQLDGRRVMYYPDGKISLIRHYKNGIADGEELSYHRNGQLRLLGILQKGEKTGLWQDWYSNGQLKKAVEFKKDKPQPDKVQQKMFAPFNKGLALAKAGDLDAAIRQFTKAIENNDSYSDFYYHRGTAYLNKLEYDNAIKDFDHAIELEPFYHQALAFRGMARIRKHELGSTRKLSGNSEVTVLAGSAEGPMPDETKSLVCRDLLRAIEFGNSYQPVLTAFDKYCR